MNKNQTNKQYKNSKTLVLGGGGVTGIAWMTGLLKGLEQQGLNISEFDRFIGTSAGSTVVAQITSGLGLEELYQRQIVKEKQVKEISPSINFFKIIIKVLPALLVRKTPIKFRQRIGSMALSAKTVSEQARREIIAERLPKHEWPEVRLDIMAINSNTGEAINFTNKSAVNLVDAVAASCAVPGVWPCVEINHAFYFDGGIRSADNADYAVGAEKVLIISPLGLGGMSMPGGSLKNDVKLLEEAGSRVVLISPDQFSKTEMGKNPLNPLKREAAARAGLKQGLGLEFIF